MALEAMTDGKKSETYESIGESPEHNSVVHALRKKPRLLAAGCLGEELLGKLAERNVAEAGDERAGQEDRPEDDPTAARGRDRRGRDRQAPTTSGAGHGYFCMTWSM